MLPAIIAGNILSKALDVLHVECFNDLAPYHFDLPIVLLTFHLLLL